MNIPLVARALLGLHNLWPGLPGSIAARPRERRHAPWGDLDGDHRSMLARLYGGGATLDRAPALDTSGGGARSTRPREAASGSPSWSTCRSSSCPASDRRPTARWPSGASRQGT